MIDELIAEARTYLGVPWRHQGRTRKGVDCVGFLLLAFKHIGIHIDEIKGYARNPDGFKLKAVMDGQPNMHPIPFNELQIGDIILLRIRHHPQHVALVTDGPNGELNMIHSYNGGRKVVVEHNLADYWKTKIVAAYRLNQE